MLLPDFETPCRGASLLTHPVTCVSNDLISIHTHRSQLPVFSNMSTDGSPSQYAALTTTHVLNGKDGYKGGDSFSKVADVLNSDIVDEGSVFLQYISRDCSPCVGMLLYYVYN